MPCDCFPLNRECPSAARCTQSKGSGHPGYLKLVNEIRDLHVVKSGGYGTGRDPFANFTAVAALTGDPPYLYPIRRALEKLARCESLHAQGRVVELGEEFLDIASLMLCAEAMRRDDHP